jgi:hypothetical protein
MARWIGVFLMVVVAALFVIGGKKFFAPAQQQQEMAAPQEPAGGTMAPEAASEPGMAWQVPTSWRTGEGSSMRVATYLVDPEGECAVFHFGANQGGGLDDNIDRWAGQFEGAPKPARSTLTVDGMKVTRVRIDGTFLSPGMDMKSTGSKPGWRLLGAIVEGPNGSVFFKFFGPAATLAAAEKDFDAMLASLHKH